MALRSSEGLFLITRLYQPWDKKTSTCLSGEIVTSPTEGFRCLFVLQRLPRQIKCSVCLFANAAQNEHRRQVWFDRRFKGNSSQVQNPVLKGYQETPSSLLHAPPERQRPPAPRYLRDAAPHPSPPRSLLKSPRGGPGVFSLPDRFLRRAGASCA